MTTLFDRLKELREKATPGPWSSSEQNGVPRHCYLAQVWDSNGNSLAEIEPTADAVEATATASLIIELVNNLDTILSAISEREGWVLVPKGWVLVPEEATGAMWEAGMAADEHLGDSYSAVYRAMISAAPSAQGEE